MAANERSISEVLQDIVRNVQEIVRSEVRLAKTEIRDEVIKTKSAGVLLGTGAVMAIFACGFLLLTLVYALAMVMPNWAAALVVGGILAAGAGVAITAGRKQLKEVHPTPERTVETLKENVEWVQQRTK